MREEKHDVGLHWDMVGVLEFDTLGIFTSSFTLHITESHPSHITESSVLASILQIELRPLKLC